MALDGMGRVLELHAQWLKSWRRQLQQLESGKLTHWTKGPSDPFPTDITPDMIKDLKKRIAMVEELDKPYRP